MNKNAPLRDFLLGIGIGFVAFLVAVLGFGAAFLYAVLSPTLSGGAAVTQSPGFMALAALGVLGVCAGLVLTVRAFFKDRPYHGLGVLSVFLVPLLFFGVCTMFVS